MTSVHVGDGRTVQLTGDASGTIGDLADAIAHDAYDTGNDGAFSFKVDGVVMHPDTQAAQVALGDDTVVELVEVTDQHWPGDTPPADGTIRVEVPEGTVEDLIDWVGDDQARAEATVATEELQEHPRVTLLEHLRAHFDLED